MRDLRGCELFRQGMNNKTLHGFSWQPPAAELTQDRQIFFSEV